VTEARQLQQVSAMPGKLNEPRVITDYRREPVCILPAGFHLDDARWEAIWQRFEEKGTALSHDDLRALFPDEPALQVTPR
jgi:hypothetical protein